jgi:hypothetical protein
LRVTACWWPLTLAVVLLPAGAAPPKVGACQILPSDHIFNSRIDALPVHPDSAAYLQTISSGTRNLHLDLGTSENMASADYYGIPYNAASGSAITWQPLFYGGGWPDESDCAKADHSIASPCVNTGSQALMPMPANPKVEGGIEPNPAIEGDHHILSIDLDRCVLWEAYHSYPRTGGGWNVLSSAAFDLKSNALRPAGWTSADAAGFPVMPLLLRADEASAGEITHALRFTIQSSKIRTAYVWPARHLTSNGGSSSAKPAMGQLFRLRADYGIPANYTVQAQAILAAMKRYGMYIADGGSDMYVTGEPSALWQDATISQVQSVPHTAFEAVDLAPIMARTGFNANSAAVPPASGAFSITPNVIRSGSTLSLSATVTVSSADQGQPGFLYVVAWVPALGGLWALTPQGWQAVAGGSVAAYANTTLGTHNLTVLAGVDVSGLSGLMIFAGYGLSTADLLAGNKYVLIYRQP